MKALERINQIEVSIPLAKAANGMPAHFKYDISPESIEFLFRAFEVMRSIAVRYSQDLKVKMGNGDFIVPGWAYMESTVDEEFEKRMLDGR